MIKLFFYNREVSLVYYMRYLGIRALKARDIADFWVQISQKGKV